MKRSGPQPVAITAAMLYGFGTILAGRAGSLAATCFLRGRCCTRAFHGKLRIDECKPWRLRSGLLSSG
jgi:hypothetical protein